ncbi:hypothetical protein VNO78_22461 [Psophocarpus tetragonolobus]|uniref:Uncharacterized protein n=1 Tax=Psophocarpus tetragonolobus TaxID=3891 RepID=A0AAN9XBH8_PSOTE
MMLIEDDNVAQAIMNFVENLNIRKMWRIDRSVWNRNRRGFVFVWCLCPHPISLLPSPLLQLPKRSLF